MITAIVNVSCAVDRIPEIGQAIADLAGVSEVYSVAGDVDLVAMVRVRRHEDLADVIAGRLNKVEGVLSTQTLSTVKDDSGSGAASAATPPTPKPHLDGTVTSVSGSTVLIKDREGFTRTIVLSSKTTYDDGLKAALATGTKIQAEGTVDANGTSLDATTVGADKGPTGAPGGGRGGPKGGPGRDGDHPGPPTGGPDGKGPDGKSPAASTAPTGTKSGSATTAPSTSSSAQPTK